MNSLICVLGIILLGNFVSTTIGSKIHLLSHITKDGDTAKLDDTILEELASDSSMILKSQNANKIVYHSLRKFLAIILMYSETELDEFINILLGQMTYKVKFQTVEQFRSKFTMMAQRSGFGVKYVLLTWWIYLNDDDELKSQIDTVNTFMMLDPIIADTYLDALKLFSVVGKDMIEYETTAFLKQISSSDDNELNQMLTKLVEAIYRRLVVHDDAAVKVLRKTTIKVSKHILTDFLYELVKNILDYDKERTMQFFDMLDVEFRNYKYKGGKFETIFTTKDREDAYNNFISSFGRDYFTIQENLKILKTQMEDPLKEKSPFLKIINILDKTYNITHQEKLDHLLIQVGRYATDNINLNKVVRDVLRLVIFDHVDDLNMDTKNMLANINASPKGEIIGQTNEIGAKLNGTNPNIITTPQVINSDPSISRRKDKHAGEKRRHRKRKYNKNKIEKSRRRNLNTVERNKEGRDEELVSKKGSITRNIARRRKLRRKVKRLREKSARKSEPADPDSKRRSEVHTPEKSVEPKRPSKVQPENVEPKRRSRVKPENDEPKRPPQVQPEYAELQLPTVWQQPDNIEPKRPPQMRQPEPTNPIHPKPRRRTTPHPLAGLGGPPIHRKFDRMQEVS